MARINPLKAAKAAARARLRFQKRVAAAQKKAVKQKIAALKKILRPKPKPPKPRPPVVQMPMPPAAQKPEKGRPANNTTCDIYHGNGGGAVDVANVALHLSSRFQAGGEASEGDATLRWTHIAYFDPTTDIRDNYPAAPNTVIKVPTGGATVFDIVFVELVNRGLPSAYKRVFLDRQEPTWPTDVV